MPSDPHNHAVYTLKKISTKDIFRIVFGYTDYFDDKNIKRITAWCSKKKKKKTSLYQSRGNKTKKKEFFGYF